MPRRLSRYVLNASSLASQPAARKAASAVGWYGMTTSTGSTPCRLKSCRVRSKYDFAVV